MDPRTTARLQPAFSHTCAARSPRPRVRRTALPTGAAAWHDLAARHDGGDAHIAVFAGPFIETEFGAAVDVFHRLADEGLGLLEHLLHLLLHREVLALLCADLLVKFGFYVRYRRMKKECADTFSAIVAVIKDFR